MIDYSPFTVSLLITTGFVAGIVNTLAGGGSNLTVPALMVMGLPADVANGTNRVGVMLQSLAGVRGFHRFGKLDTSDMFPVLIPNLLGGIVGAVLAAILPVTLLKPLLLGTMVGLSLLILIRPSVVAPPPGTPVIRVKDSPLAWWALFAAGVYGGFAQGGVGFVLIAALAGTLRYDLLRTNALKMLCTGTFTLVSLAIFVFDGLVLWIPGLILGIATMLGAIVAVRISLHFKQEWLKWFLFAMTLCASAAALLK
jgi:uncharacterized protein